MPRPRRDVWLEGLAIAACSGCVLYAAMDAGPRDPAPDFLPASFLLEILWDRRFVAATFFAGVIGLLAFFILSVTAFRSDPWRPRDNRLGRAAAWTVSGGLLVLSLSMIGPSSISYFLPSLIAFALCTATLALAARRLRRPLTLAPATPELEFFADASVSEASRADVLRLLVRRAVSARDETLRRWLAAVLDRSLDPTLEAALFAALADAPPDFLEPLLARLLSHESPKVQANVAHLLAWFGTRDAIQKLRSVKGSAADAAEAAAARIQGRALANEGGLALAPTESDGAVSIVASGELSLHRRPA